MPRLKVELKERDLGLTEILKRAKEIHEGRVKVGVLANGKGGDIHDGSELTKAQIASILEFGTEDGRIPPRPALRSTFEEQRDELIKLGTELIEKILEGKMETNRALGIMGAKLAAETKKTITTGAGVPPPNAPSTIAAKGSDRPWVNTGATVNAITWEVQEGDGDDKEESGE